MDVVQFLTDAINFDPTQASEPFIATSERTYSLKELLSEIENKTEFGLEYVRSFEKMKKEHGEF